MKELTARRRFTAGLLGLVLAAAALGACSRAADRASTSSSAGGSQVASAPSEPSESAEPAESADQPSPAPTAPVDPATGAGEGAPAEVLGFSTGQHRADPNDRTAVPLRLDVTSVRRLDGDLLEVRFAITNIGTDAAYQPWSTLNELGGPSQGAYDVSAAVVLDAPGDKRYLTLHDSAGACLCTVFPDHTGAAPGESLDAYAKFPAPPASTTTVEFSLPGFTPVGDLEIG